MRYDRQVSDDTAVKFMTDGILLRELQGDLLLRAYSILVLDEAHERSLNTDLLLGMSPYLHDIKIKLFPGGACGYTQMPRGEEQKIF